MITATPMLGPVLGPDDLRVRLQDGRDRDALLIGRRDVLVNHIDMRPQSLRL